DLVVEKGALAEFAGAGQARAEARGLAQDPVEDDRAAVSLQLENVFSSKGMRAGEKQRDAAVEQLRLGRGARVEAAVVRCARRQFAADDTVHQCARKRTGYADDADPTAPGGRGDSGDGVVVESNHGQ